MRYVPDARRAIEELKMETANEFGEERLDEKRKNKSMIKKLTSRGKTKRSKKD